VCQIPGTALLPTTCKVCNPCRLPRLLGSEDGTPGKVNCLVEYSDWSPQGNQRTYSEETRPEPSHVTPVHAQNRTFVNQPPLLRLLCPSAPACSNTALNPQNWRAFTTCCPSCAFVNVKLAGIVWRMGRQVEQGYEDGLVGALSSYCEMHCWASIDSVESLVRGGGLEV
jgi:hypothetical protein